MQVRAGRGDVGRAAARGEEMLGLTRATIPQARRTIVLPGTVV